MRVTKWHFMGSKLRTTCLHRTITINSKDYDLYMGYLSSDEIRKIAEVPSFSKSDSNLDIVENIPPKTDPVEAWQRPVDNEDIKGAKVKSKVTRIAKIYSSSSNVASKKQTRLPSNCPA